MCSVPGIPPEYRIPNEDPGGKGFHGHDRDRSLFLPDGGEQRQALGHRGVFKMAKHHLRLDAECGFGISTRSWVTPPLSRYALSFSLWNSASLRMTEQLGHFSCRFGRDTRDLVHRALLRILSLGGAKVREFCNTSEQLVRETVETTMKEALAGVRPGSYAKSES